MKKALFFVLCLSLLPSTLLLAEDVIDQIGEHLGNDLSQPHPPAEYVPGSCKNHICEQLGSVAANFCSTNLIILDFTEPKPQDGVCCTAQPPDTQFELIGCAPSAEKCTEAKGTVVDDHHCAGAKLWSMGLMLPGLECPNLPINPSGNPFVFPVED